MVVGGALTAVATAAVGGYVAVTSASGLADSPGRALMVSSIVVPAPTSSPTPSTTATPPVAPVAETVPAAEPGDVAAPVPRTPISVAPEPAAPFAPAAAAPLHPAPPAATTTTDAADEAPTALEVAREWAAEEGWDESDIPPFVEDQPVEAELNQRSSQTPTDSVEDPSVPESPSSWIGSEEEEQSPDSLQDD